MRQLLHDAVRTGRLVPVTAYQRFGYLCAALLALSGVFHAVVFLLDGGGWQGPLSWRKPTVFGLSFGITLATFSWILGFLRPARRAGWVVVGILSVASLGEVLLISMQTWRRVPSHFNESTPFDSAVFGLMGFLVTILGVMTVVITLWAFVRIDAPPSLRLAIRLGLVLMLVSQAVGVQMIAEGGHTYGSAGALKVPHALTLHAAQLLPALALLVLVSKHTERRRMEIVGLGALGYAVVIASTLAQTYAGQAPLDLTLTSSALAVTGLVLLGVSAGLALRGLAHRAGPPVGPPPGTVGPAVPG
jgi:hypothetical protein